MDFGSLLQTAKENEQSNKREVRSYSTKFSAPKKEEKKARSLSANIQKFLARKEAEEKKKTHEANKIRDDLLALRSKDKKATRRVNVMLKRTKSANQSVIEDAVDKDNTAVTLAGPSQPDEDDYGYVSQEATAFYNKMMEKYNKMPDDPKFSLTKKKASMNMSSTKDRVRAALDKEKEEAMLPHRRKRKHKEHTDNELDESERREDTLEREEKSESVKVKPKIAAPPLLNFSELLKLAAQKQHEPIMIEVKPKEEDGPLMTKKQKKEHDRVQQWKEGKKQTTKMLPAKSNTEQAENRIPKLPSTQLSNHKPKEVADKQISKSINPYKNNGKIDKGNMQNAYNSSNSSKSALPPTAAQNVKVRERDGSILKSALKTQKPPLKSEGSSIKLDSSRQQPPGGLPRKNIETKSNKLGANKQQSLSGLPRKSVETNSTKLDTNRQQSFGGSSRKSIESNSNKLDTNRQQSLSGLPKKSIETNLMPNIKPSASKVVDKKFLASKSAPSSSAMHSPPKSISKPITNPNSLKKDLKVNGYSREYDRQKPVSVRERELPPPKKFPPDDLRPKQFPPKDLKSKQFPPSDVRRREFPPKDMKRKPPLGSKRRILDDDEDYDSEMDDFIDDGPEEMEDYSKYIKDIFGYDKSKYRGYDEDDVDNMESTFAQQMREDIRSTKLGIMEDLEDIQREKEEKRRKAVMKKKRRL